MASQQTLSAPAEIGWQGRRWAWIDTTNRTSDCLIRQSEHCCATVQQLKVIVAQLLQSQQISSLIVNKSARLVYGKIDIQTKEQSAALQWLEPAQTFKQEASIHVLVSNWLRWRLRYKSSGLPRSYALHQCPSL